MCPKKIKISNFPLSRNTSEQFRARFNNMVIDR